ncbi:MAG: T9SS type A sorting domain-containing protein [Chitinophagales bacterium]|nr:T9SS type A sorting domain-containing protein [Chitinophagales bacterium]
MRKLFTILLISIAINSYANSGGPDVWGYKWYDSNDTSVNAPVYNWIDITTFPNATGVKLLADDNTRGPFVMNFDFHYYWYDVNQFWVGSNGYIIFQDEQLASPFPSAKSQTPPNNFIGALMNDLTFLQTDNPGQCWYWMNDAHDTLIVSWLDVPFYNTGNPGYTGSNTFQIILSAEDNSITFQYENVDASSPFSGISFAGIENNSGAVGLWWSNTSGSPTASPSDFYAVRYVYPLYDTVSVIDPGVDYCDNPGTKGIFLSQSSTPYPLIANIINYGTKTVDSVLVNIKVKDPTNATVVDQTTYTGPITSLQSVAAASAQSLIPNLAGTWQFITTTVYTGDVANKNNSQKLEIVVVDTTVNDMILGFDGNQIGGLSGVNWVGDDGGCGMYFKPPFYPIVVTKLQYWITSNFNNVAFNAEILDDDGINGLPYSVYDSIYVPSDQITLNGWTTLELDNPVVINSGGFYVRWDMDGEGITLGAANNQPISHRSYEVFQYGWGIYRFGLDQDPLIRAVFENGNYPTSISNINEEDLSLNLFPNPSNENVTLLYNIPKGNSKNIMILSDVQGKQIQTVQLARGSGMHQNNLDVTKLAPGVYFATLISGNEKTVQKLIVAK